MPQDTSWSTAIPVCSPPGRQNGGGDHKYSAACAAHVATESRQGDQQALLQPARITLTQYTSEHRHCTDQSAEQAKAGGTVHTQPAVAVGQWHSHAKENSSKLKPPKPKGKSHINKKTSAHSLKDKVFDAKLQHTAFSQSAADTLN